MTRKPTAAVIAATQKLYKGDATARRLFDALAQRQRDATATNIDLLSRQLNVSRGDALALARAIGETGAATLYLGRRGSKTRLVWEFSCVSVGRAASGEKLDLEAPDNPISEEDEEANEQAAQIASGTAPVPTSLTIREAKRLLSASLGVDEADIEISIRA
jgi:hypothetical protein